MNWPTTSSFGSEVSTKLACGSLKTLVEDSIRYSTFNSLNRVKTITYSHNIFVNDELDINGWPNALIRTIFVDSMSSLEANGCLILHTQDERYKS
jgi:hypothetical protein